MARRAAKRYVRPVMPSSDNITSAIVDALYETALDLAEETRDAFERAETALNRRRDGEALRAALSRQALRTNTKLMHAMAWLLNHRAFFAGDMNEAQLRRHGALPPVEPGRPDPLHAFDSELLDVIERTRGLHARIARLDTVHRAKYASRPAAPVHRLHDRLGQAFG